VLELLEGGVFVFLIHIDTFNDDSLFVFDIGQFSSLHTRSLLLILWVLYIADTFIFNVISNIMLSSCRVSKTPTLTNESVLSSVGREHTFVFAIRVVESVMC
jgi:hypothetical protein